MDRIASSEVRKCTYYVRFELDSMNSKQVISNVRMQDLPKPLILQNTNSQVVGLLLSCHSPDGTLG